MTGVQTCALPICYVHGIFDKAEAAAALVNALLEAKGLEPGAASVDWQAYAQQQYDKLAAGLRASLDMKRIYRILNGSMSPAKTQTAVRFIFIVRLLSPIHK